MVDVLLDRVSKQYGDVWAIRDLSLRVETGEAVVLLGPTGSGKTTLLRLTAGFEEPTSGDILFDGRPAASEPDKRNVSMLFAENRLYPRMSARSNIGFPLSVRNTPEPEKTQRVEAEARALGIERLLKRRPGTLSAGQSDLVHLAKSMIRAPGLFLIDEPLDAIDAGARRELRRELKRIQQGYGATAIYATHDQEDAMSLGDRLVIIENGRIRQGGPPTEVYARPDDTFVARFLGTPEMSMLAGTRTRYGVAVGDLRLRVPPEIPKKVLVGVRPERWVESDAGLLGRVTEVEDFGTDVYVSLSTEAGDVRVRWFDRAPARGTSATVVPESFHLFDPETGQGLFHS